ncbi:protein-disulfide reductase DsbD domain-containing protein [uncultured Hoeflea sp.]|uniref:protein-disulfide reductase DsbD domain-containing protein n=1 Tax=uncultured Hoeflea sp. TaxID=538666 RepID=UPI0030D9AB87
MIKQRLKSVCQVLALGLLAQTSALFLNLTPAWSLDSGWAETEGGRMRLVVDPTPRSDGMIAGYLDIALDPGWKTYWRDPGSAGIPPTLDFSQSQGITFEKMDYPAPVRVDDGYAIWAGYTEPVQFPLTFRPTASAGGQIHALAFIGICEKICVPFQAELVVDLPENLTAQDPVKPDVDQAFARLPEAAGSDFGINTASLDLSGNQLTVLAKLPAFRPSGVAAELFVAGPQGFAFSPPKLISEHDGVAEWTVAVEPPSGMDAASDTVALDLVVTLGQRAIEQSVSVGGAAVK